MKRLTLLLPLALALLFALIAARLSTSAATTPSETPPGEIIACPANPAPVQKQMNFRAGLQLRACGLGDEPVNLASGGGGPGPASLGGADKDIISGGEGVYPQVTQSDTPSR